MGDNSDAVLGLLEKHGRRLHALLFRMTLRHEIAEELLQELFVRLATSKSFSRSSNPEGYLFRSAINLGCDWRKQQILAGKSVSCDEHGCDSDGPVEQVLLREQIEMILSLLGELSQAHRDWISLRFIDGMSYEQLADHFDTTTHRARAKCSKAVARLRKLACFRMAEYKSDECP